MIQHTRKYFIWSYRHDQWWGPDKSGYTLHLNRAGQYSREEAAQITIDECLPGANVAVSDRLAKRLVGLTCEQIGDELSQWRRL